MKEPVRYDLVCYCFNYCAQDIREDVLEHGGRSLILEKIIAERQAGHCQCAIRHPEGR
jgi:hypothetical protein